MLSGYVTNVRTGFGPAGSDFEYEITIRSRNQVDASEIVGQMVQVVPLPAVEGPTVVDGTAVRVEDVMPERLPVRKALAPGAKG